MSQEKRELDVRQYPPCGPIVGEFGPLQRDEERQLLADLAQFAGTLAWYISTVATDEGVPQTFQEYAQKFYAWEARLNAAPPF